MKIFGCEALRARPVTLALSLVTALGSSVAHAQQAPAIELQLFHPALDNSGLVNVETAAVGGHLGTRVGLWANGATRVLRTEVDGSGAQLGYVVRSRYDASLVTSLSLWNRLELGLELPTTLYQAGLDTDLVQQVAGKTRLASAGLGDVHALVKGVVLREDDAPAVALALGATFPTGSDDELFGEPSVVVSPMAIVSRRFGQSQAALDLGLRYRSEPMRILGEELGSELFYRAAYTYDLREVGRPSVYSILLGLHGQTAAGAPFGLGESDRASFHSTLELLAGGQRRLATEVGAFRVTLAVGVGLLPGYGTPLARGIVGVDFVNREPFTDDDLDRVLNADDECPVQPEDLDEFQDRDGCPELDNDGDGIEDVDDDCPGEPEDKDDFEDFDGCPEETDRDADLDGINDRDDKCADSKEDADGFEDEDGCLDPDNDSDTLTDLTDLCPDEAEDQATSKDHDGCPEGETAEQLVALDKGLIGLKRQVTFKGAAVARSAAVVLNQVAALLLTHDELLEVDIVVSATSDARAQEKLAERRAKKVVAFLVSRGVAPERLHARVAQKPTPTPHVRVVVTKTSQPKPEGRPGKGGGRKP